MTSLNANEGSKLILSSEGMAVPKSKRSKAKGKTRLSNWKAKAKSVASKALSKAKTILNRKKKEEKPLEQDSISSKSNDQEVNKVIAETSPEVIKEALSKPEVPNKSKVPSKSEAPSKPEVKGEDDISSRDDEELKA